MSISAAIYARISQDNRAGTSEEGASTAAQVEACRAYIARQGRDVGTVYVDNSFSATSSTPEGPQVTGGHPPPPPSKHDSQNLGKPPRLFRR
ncbi:recombinase family protein [Micrococcus sp. UYEF12]|uniref:recombinase family protein n=1 Tax=Micrococcus sp. UYEF12 TaxID=1756388 RepID=UPI00339995F9